MLKKYAHIVFLLLILPFGMSASHIVGGDFSLKSLGGNQYLLTLKVLRDCENGIPWFNIPLAVGLFEKKTNSRQETIYLDGPTNDTLNFSSKGCIRIPTGCTHVGTYTKVITLDPSRFSSNNGYYFSWERCCRNTIIRNIVVGTQPGVTGMTYYMEIPPLSIKNSTPVFKSAPLTLICIGNPFEFNYDCTDADGDSLVYSLVTPLAGNTSDQNPNDPDQPGYPSILSGPYKEARWQRNYSLTNIMDANPRLQINSQTGQLTVTPRRMGVYALAIKVEEFRNGVKIGEVRRELQLTVSSCLQNPSPYFNSEVRDSFIVINAGDTLQFPISVKDPNSDSLKLTITGDVFAGGKVKPPFAQAAESDGKASLSSRFFWATSCEQGNPNDTFNVQLKVKDNGCPINKTARANIRIVVLPQPPPLPPDVLCIERPDDNTIQLTLGGWVKSKYATKYILARKNPDSTVTLLDSFPITKLPNSYTDKTAFNHRINFYKYFIYGYNKCGKRGINSYEANTDPNIPKIPLTPEISLVTVRPVNKGVEIYFKTKTQDNFDFYTIYRKSSAKNDTFRPVAIVKNRNAKMYYDSLVDVNKYSYCYEVQIKNKCGFFSEKSKRSCSILLKGESAPFVNYLNYNQYSTWTGGVDNYQVFRRFAEEDVSAFRSIVQVSNNTFNYEDDKLDVDHGAYYYRIKAIENVIVGGQDPQVSQSNDIYLIQKPLLYPPNAFTANGDGLNDSFNTSPIFVKDYNIKIYNRWGERVFSSDNKRQHWNGVYRGNTPFNNVYIWQVIYTGYDGETYYRYGNVTTLR